jgi:hypothetical protein
MADGQNNFSVLPAFRLRSWFSTVSYGTPSMAEFFSREKISHKKFGNKQCGCGSLNSLRNFLAIRKH